MQTPRAAKILIVEDDPTMRSVLRTLLEIEGYTVVTVPDRKTGQEILAIMKEESPDVVLMDVHLQQVNGIEILKLMRADPALQGVQVVMSSGSDRKAECLQAGATAFVMKPYMPDELLDLLKAGR